MKKKFFSVFLGFILIASLIPAIVVPIVLSVPTNQHGWNINPLIEKIKNKDTFIAYYGRESCPHCKKLNHIIRNDIVQKALKDLAKKTQNDDVLHWFYNKESQNNLRLAKKFERELNEIIPPNLEAVKGVPTWLFFVRGELVKIINPLNDIYNFKPAEVGDEIQITFEGESEGAPFEDGRQDNPTWITVSKEGESSKYIGGFESGLRGAEKGESISLNLVFPENYEANPDLAGKAVTFNVEVLQVKNKNINEAERAKYLAQLIQNNEKW